MTDYRTLDNLYEVIDIELDLIESEIAFANSNPEHHDLYFVTKDTLTDRILRHCTEIVEEDEIKYSGMKHAVQYKLNYRGYYSIGGGLFVQINSINSVAVLDLVINNASEDVKGRNLALARKKELKKNIIEGQMRMLFTNSNCLDKLQEEIESKQQFLEKLEEYAV